MNPKPKIFFSYAWGDANETGESRGKMVDDLYLSLTNAGYELIRDKNNLGYKGFISDFMRSIGEGECVVPSTSTQSKALSSSAASLSLAYKLPNIRKLLQNVINDTELNSSG